MTLSNYTLGIDVGGTTIDGVIVNRSGTIINSCKVAVTHDIETSIKEGIITLLQCDKIEPAHCNSIHLGTTVALNGLLEPHSLYKVGVLRIAGHCPDVPPAYEFPTQSREILIAGHTTINGGREIDNRPITPLQPAQLISAVEQLLAQGAQALAIVGVFSTLYPEDEIYAQQLIQQHFGQDIVLTLSHQLGGLGFAERENNTLINTALKKVVTHSFNRLSTLCTQLGFSCDLLVTQNNGTLISMQDAINFPIKTLYSGATNSLVGASRLAKMQDAAVVDIGGTSTDIGIVENGFPRHSYKASCISNIPLHFNLPDVNILSLGGGSILNKINHRFQLTDQSLGYRIFTDSQSVGGNQLTLFDIGNKLNANQSADYQAINISKTQAESILHDCLNNIKSEVSELVFKKPVPIVLVGGGAQIIPDYLLDTNMLMPRHFEVANAYGAALAEISGQVDQIVYLDKQVETTLAALEEKAKQQAIINGANPQTVRLIEKTLLPLYYMPNQMTRVVMVAAGEPG